MAYTVPDPRTNHERTLDSLVERAAGWTPTELTAAAMQLALRSTEADLAVLYCFVQDRALCLGSSPRHLESPLAADQSLDWFPWDLRKVRVRSYVFVPDATKLKASPSATLGELGVASALHLQLEAPEERSGAIHIFWREPRGEWDDGWGSQLRALGSFVLLRAA